MATATTTTPLPSDAIQRILFLCGKVHVYSIPPLTSNKGYLAAGWTDNNNSRQIFTARMRVLETSIPPPPASSAPPNNSAEKISAEILLEDPATGELFAGAPYTDAKVVESAVDSSRFFAVRVTGDGGRKATLGIGFEERSEAIDFGICLQECRKVLGFEGEGSQQQGSAAAAKKGGTKAGGGAGVNEAQKKDWSLKEGETIKIDIGRKGRRRDGQVEDADGSGSSHHHQSATDALFSIKPPPSANGDQGSGGGIPVLAPPPSATESRAEKRRSRGISPGKVEAKDLGFDDGEFGEFQ